MKIGRLFVHVTAVLLTEATLQNWWNMASFCFLANTTAVRTALIIMHALTEDQWKLLQRYPRVTEAVVCSTDQARQECSQMMRYNRWNCASRTAFSTYGDIAKRDNREKALLSALTTASLVQRIWQTCTMGEIPSCACWSRDLEPAVPDCFTPDEFALRFAESFIRARRPRSEVHLDPTSHNVQIGLKVVRSTLKRTCRCHGTSGACTVTTCLNILPSFHAIGLILKSKYHQAVEVNQDIKRSLKYGTKILRSSSIPIDAILNYAVDRLIYVDASPDFCEPDDVVGLPGVRGRLCKNIEEDEDNCDELCCTHGHTTTVHRRSQGSCNCVANSCCTRDHCSQCKITEHVEKRCL